MPRHSSSGEITLSIIKTACSNCNLRELCLPFGLNTEELERLDDLVSTRRRIKRGEHLYRAGEAFDAIYAIRSGFFKTDVLLEDGRDQVTFQMAGDCSDSKSLLAPYLNAIALEDNEIAIPSPWKACRGDPHTLLFWYERVANRDAAAHMRAGNASPPSAQPALTRAVSPRRVRRDRDEINTSLNKTVCAFSRFRRRPYPAEAHPHPGVNSLKALMNQRSERRRRLENTHRRAGALTATSRSEEGREGQRPVLVVEIVMVTLVTFLVELTDQGDVLVQGMIDAHRVSTVLDAVQGAGAGQRETVLVLVLTVVHTQRGVAELVGCLQEIALGIRLVAGPVAAAEELGTDGGEAQAATGKAVGNRFEIAEAGLGTDFEAIGGEGLRWSSSWSTG
jgi:CRP/FNR family transcriptional regulator